ncbi:MAG: hypothetical protein COA69_06845 [Robiginitomaculum sp.]|nr:MAG: hypothetical protein COA69_06845 [Robiginitomaculum sp.]
MQAPTLKRRTRDIILLVILVLAMALPGLGGLPVIDRDEARYAQASVQMMESGDYINIRFQDQARNKKPAGAYWLQSLSVKAFSDVENRSIWAHRIPSVIAALLAVLATYWGGIRLLGRDSALIGSALLATSMMFVFEAHIAKTDALLCGCAALSLASLAYLRTKDTQSKARGPALVFWGAMGCAVMIKGPILPILVGICILSLLVWERKATWLKPLGFWLGPVLFFAIILPWAVLIWQETNGAFFTEAIGGDLTPKLIGGHERHGGPPGYYTLSTWLAFWPGCLFLLPGLVFCVQAGRGTNGFDTPVAQAARLLLCWSLPFFILLEIIPTKLPHYPLPIYPAWALMAGAAIMTLSKMDAFRFWRRFGAVIFASISIVLATALLAGEAYYSADFPTWSFAVLYVVILLCLFSALKMWKGQSQPAFVAVIGAAFLTTMLSYQFTLPSLKELQISKQVEMALRAENIDLAQTKILSTQFTEPSLVYRLGTHILLGKPQERLANLSLESGDIVILDRERDETEGYEIELMRALKANNTCLQSLSIVDGFNYAKGNKVALDLLRVEICALDESSVASVVMMAIEGELSPATRSETPTTTPDP